MHGVGMGMTGTPPAVILLTQRKNRTHQWRGIKRKGTENKLPVTPKTRHQRHWQVEHGWYPSPLQLPRGSEVSPAALWGSVQNPSRKQIGFTLILSVHIPVAIILMFLRCTTARFTPESILQHFNDGNSVLVFWRCFNNSISFPTCSPLYDLLDSAGTPQGGYRCCGIPTRMETGVADILQAHRNVTEMWN